jgi:hypothetical protein
MRSYNETIRSMGGAPRSDSNRALLDGLQGPTFSCLWRVSVNARQSELRLQPLNVRRSYRECIRVSASFTQQKLLDLSQAVSYRVSCVQFSQLGIS